MACGRRRLGYSFVLILLVLAAVPALVAAQTFEGPPASYTGGITPTTIATGRDGSVLIVGDHSGIYTQRFPNAGLVPTPPVAAPPAAYFGTALTALAHGGYALAWNGSSTSDLSLTTTITQRLSSKGEPLGFAMPAAFPTVAVRSPGIGPRGDGFVVGWQQDVTLFLRPFDFTGAPSGPLFDDGPEEEADTTRIVGVPGGFLMVWGGAGVTQGQRFDAALNPLTPRFTVATSFRFTSLAVNPAGTLAAITGIPHAGDPSSGERRVRFFHPDGSYVSDDIVMGYGVDNAPPRVASDGSGNFLVVWGERLDACAFDGNGTRLGAVQELLTDRVSNMQIVGRRDAGFFLVWRQILHFTENLVAARATLCTPGSAVCGDGTVVPTCEVCDDGVGNSDNTPDACRTDCQRPRCGDGVTDAGEQCDDGNVDRCDGCDDACDLETGTICGDGVLAPLGCSEECDDANAVIGDGCSTSCEVERIPGGGKSVTDCYAAWRIDNPSNAPRYDKYGFVNPHQACADNDPACDFDGGVVGSCTFHLAVCANNSAPPSCTPSRVRSWVLASPSAKQALTRPALAAVRATLESVVPPAVVGASDPNLCSPDAAIVVPLRGQPGAYKAAKLKLKARADVYSGAIDSDTLQLRCNPS